MTCDEDPFRRRPRKSTVRQKTMGEVRLDDGNYGKMAFRVRSTHQIRLPHNCRGKTVTMAAHFGYDRHGFEGYLGNVG